MIACKDCKYYRYPMLTDNSLKNKPIPIIIMCDGDYKEALKMLIDKIEHAPTIDPQRWMPCSERLPKEDTDVLVTYVNGEEIRIAPVNYGCGAWYDCIFETTLDPLKVTAWMPLPEPYAERRTDE